MSATIANLAVLQALLQPGDTILSLGTELGGHISHGGAENLSGMAYRVVNYGFDPETEQIDLAQVEELARRHRPKLIICGSGPIPGYPLPGLWRDCPVCGGLSPGGHRPPGGAHRRRPAGEPRALCRRGYHHHPQDPAGPRGCRVILCRQELAQAIDRAVYPGLQGSPKMDMIAARAALAREAMTPEFRACQQAALDNAQALAQGLGEEGFRLVTGGTDTHLLLVDVRSHIATGEEADRVLSSVGLVVNREPIPLTPSRRPPAASASAPPALTTRGLEGPQFRQIARWISQALHSAGAPRRLAEIRGQVTALAQQYPLFAERWIPREKSVNTP